MDECRSTYDCSASRRFAARSVGQVSARSPSTRPPLSAAFRDSTAASIVVVEKAGEGLRFAAQQQAGGGGDAAPCDASRAWY